MTIFSRLPSLWRSKSVSTPKDSAHSSLKSSSQPISQDMSTAVAPANSKPLDNSPAPPVINAPKPKPAPQTQPQAPTLNENGHARTPFSSVSSSNATPRSNYVPPDFAIDEWRRMKVVIIGAGYSGITAGIRCAPLPFVTVLERLLTGTSYKLLAART